MRCQCGRQMKPKPYAKPTACWICPWCGRVIPWDGENKIMVNKPKKEKADEDV